MGWWLGRSNGPRRWRARRGAPTPTGCWTTDLATNFEGEQHGELVTKQVAVTSISSTHPLPLVYESLMSTLSNRCNPPSCNEAHTSPDQPVAQRPHAIHKSRSDPISCGYQPSIRAPFSTTVSLPFTKRTNQYPTTTSRGGPVTRFYAPFLSLATQPVFLLRVAQTRAFLHTPGWLLHFLSSDLVWDFIVYTLYILQLPTPTTLLK